MKMNRGLLTLFLISYVIEIEVMNILEKKAESVEEVEENTIYLACFYLSKNYIKASRKDTESSFSNLNLSQDKLYLKLLILTFDHCKNHMKFEETSEIIDSWMENIDIDLLKYTDLMNPELRYEDIYEAFELSEGDQALIKELEDLDALFKKFEQKVKANRTETLKLIEEKNLEEKYGFFSFMGQNLWKVLYVFLICLIISGCFILLFTGFPVTGKLEALDKEEDNLIERTESNQNTTKRIVEKK